jgi:hypothetical protein
MDGKRPDTPPRFGRPRGDYAVRRRLLSNALEGRDQHKGLLENRRAVEHIPAMKKSDVSCPECNAGYRRIELISQGGAKGDFHCLLCGHLLEVFDGKTDIAIRLTVQPEKTFDSPR